jgi:hypothetical protein
MEIVCLDTQILYWAIVQKAVPGSEQLIPLAKDFIRWLDSQEGIEIIIPSIVVGEMLVPIPDDMQTEVLSQFNQDWMVVDFNLRAALFFARMRRDHIIQKRFKDIRQLHPDVTKKELVADCMIIASAVAHGATKLYSHNRDLCKLAEGYITTAGFDDESFQLSLPE